MKKLTFLFVALLFLIPAINFAQGGLEKGNWYFHPSALLFDLGSASTTTSIGGNELPGENFSFSNSTVPGVGIGYAVSPSISIFSVLSFPPTTTAEGTGNNGLDGVTAAEVTYAPFALIGIYHFKFGGFEPFIGAGLSYTAILDVEDKAVVNVEAENAFGFIFRGGVDYMFNDTWGANITVNKLFVSTEITGTAPTQQGPAPAVVDASLDPWIYTLGLVYRL